MDAERLKGQGSWGPDLLHLQKQPHWPVYEVGSCHVNAVFVAHIQAVVPSPLAQDL